jgi:AmmeMemoRadiSam system protein B
VFKKSKELYHGSIHRRGRENMDLIKPRFAGTWYPGSRGECIRTMKRFDEGWETRQETEERDDKAERRFAGGIVPHAGWYFSGETAYAVYRALSRMSFTGGKNPDLFFLFGRHQRPYDSNYLLLGEGFETPLGALKVSSRAAEMLNESFDFDTEHAGVALLDNTIELQLPFIKNLFPDAEIVAVGVSPDDRAVKIGERAFEISKEMQRTACFIGSTDLTHYGPNYGFMPHGIGSDSVRWVKEDNDRTIVDVFLRAEPEKVIETALASQNACCSGAAAAAIAGVRKGGVRLGRLIAYTTSYDRHPDSSFVGYAGVLY